MWPMSAASDAGLTAAFAPGIAEGPKDRLMPDMRILDLDLPEVRRGLEDGSMLLVDVREPHEFAAGHIPNAVNVPLPELADRMHSLPSGPIVLHCQGGTRSAIAASLVRASGRDDVADMEGGFVAWERAGLPVETKASAARGTNGAKR